MNQFIKEFLEKFGKNYASTLIKNLSETKHVDVRKFIFLARKSIKPSFDETLKILPADNFTTKLKKTTVYGFDFYSKKESNNKNFTFENFTRLCSEEEWKKVLEAIFRILQTLQEILGEKAPLWKRLKEAALFLIKSKDLRFVVNFFKVLISILSTSIIADAKRDTLDKQIAKEGEDIRNTELHTANLANKIKTNELKISDMGLKKAELVFLVDDLLDTINPLKKKLAELSKESKKNNFLIDELEALEEKKSMLIFEAAEIDKICAELSETNNTLKRQNLNNIAFQKKYQMFYNKLVEKSEENKREHGADNPPF